MAVTVSEYMTTSPHTIGSDRTLDLAITMMAEHRCHHLPVLEGGQLVGILSDRDLELLKATGSVEAMKISEVMNFEPFVVTPDSQVSKVAVEMLERGLGSAIVQATSDSPWGIFTIRDALKVIRDHVK